jgi:hypothetical protein
MLDITGIQTFVVPEKLAVLVEKNTTLQRINESLVEKNETLQKLVIVSLIIIPILGFILYQNHKSKKQKS